MLEDVLRVEEELRAHPRRACKESEGYRDELHGEAERLLLYLRERLQEGDEDSDDGGH